MATYEASNTTIKFTDTLAFDTTVGDVSGVSLSLTSGAQYKMPLGAKYPEKITGTGMLSDGTTPAVAWAGSFTSLTDKDSAGCQFLKTIVLSGEPKDMQIDMDNYKFTGKVVVQSMGTAAVQGDLVRASYSFTGVGELTRTVPA